jgi:nickel-dependent lactate racemase
MPLAPHTSITLPYGSRPLVLRARPGSRVCDLPAGIPGLDLEALLQDALDRPIGSPPLEALCGPEARVLVIVSDATRPDPRAALIRAVRARIPGARIVLAVANGTHAPGPVEALELGETDPVVRHDGTDEAQLVHFGHTRRGTDVALNRCVLEADLIVATGRIKPHYFAGFGAGIKAIFPGLGGTRAIRANHQLKREPGARPGNVDGNPCRDDMEEMLALLPVPAFLLNVVVDADDHPRAAVAGDVLAAFRVGAELARPLFRIRAPRSRAIVVSDSLPMTASLYQASKLLAAVVPIVEDGGTVIIAAECGDGTGPLEWVNRGIYELGIAPRLPAHRVVLVSNLSREIVATTYCEWAPSVDAGLDQLGVPPLIVPRAGAALVERGE